MRAAAVVELEMWMFLQLGSGKSDKRLNFVLSGWLSFIAQQMDCNFDKVHDSQQCLTVLMSVIRWTDILGSCIRYKLVPWNYLFSQVTLKCI